MLLYKPKMTEIRNAQLLGWILSTLENTSYKTTRELIQTLASRPNGHVFNDIRTTINQYENEFLLDQQNYERGCLSASARALKYDENITQRPQFKQSLINNIIYLFEKTNFDLFFSDEENKVYVEYLLEYSF
jgi:hypothetical protein